MGSVSLPMAQGPRRHCGNPEPHELHPNHVPVEGAATIPQEVRTDGTWCDGIPPLQPFVELAVRVPLVGDLDFKGEPHSEVLRCILDGLGSYIFDEMYPPTGVAKIVMRLRVTGEDGVYPIRYENGQWVASHDSGD